MFYLGAEPVNWCYLNNGDVIINLLLNYLQ